MKSIFSYLVTFFVFGMVIFYCAGLSLMFRTFKYAEVAGTVTTIGNQKGFMGFRNDYLVIDYEVKGTNYKYYRDTNLINNKKIGDTYNVLYDKTNPENTRRDYHMYLFYELGTFCLVMAVFMNYFNKNRKEEYYEESEVEVDE